MRVAIPTFDGRVAPRAEGAPEVRVLDLEGPEVETQVMPGLIVGLGAWLDLLEQAGVQWVLCGGMSPFFLNALAARRIQVMMGVAGDVEGVVEALRQGRLTLGAQVPYSVWPAGGRGPGRRCGLGPFGRRGGFGRRGRRGGAGGPPGGATGPGLRGGQP